MRRCSRTSRGWGRRAPPHCSIESALVHMCGLYWYIGSRQQK
nr:MAG TPA: hypothetical protein [Caudoviricetes sp.]